jgi:diadenosine tetraphosphatase ApaH/serine/threonine PP2A family protein phosphatase
MSGRLRSPGTLLRQRNHAASSQRAAASPVIVAARQDRPLRVAVISDIHANLHALEAVLGAIDADPPDELWCLGDLVGYGPRPNEVVEEVRRRAKVCLVGNHDLGVTGALELDEFAPDAAIAAQWTRTVLLDEHRAFLESLLPQATIEGVELYHASPRDPVWEYVISEETARDALESTVAPLVLVGHSHVALAVGLVDSALGGELAPDGTEVALDEARWLLNPGSVGQPRDGDPRAAWLELDLDRRTGLFHREPYDIARTQEELRERELPEALAERLAHGV